MVIYRKVGRTLYGFAFKNESIGNCHVYDLNDDF